MEMIEDDYDYHVSIYDFNTIITYIKKNFIQILLLFAVFFIIYTVDYISNINAMIMAQVNYMNTQPQPKQQIKHSKGRKMSVK